MSDMISFGGVRMESLSCDILLIRKKVKQAQMMVPTAKSRSIENIRLEILIAYLLNVDRHFLTTWIKLLKYSGRKDQKNLR